MGHRQPRRAPAGEPLPAGRRLRAGDDQPAHRPRPRARRDSAPAARGPRRCCCSPCPDRPTSTRARSWACPRSPTCLRPRARTRGSAAPAASPPAATAAACRCPGPGPGADFGFSETAVARAALAPPAAGLGRLQRRGAARRPGLVPQPVPGGPPAAPRAPGPWPRHPALARQPRTDAQGLLCFAREPGFIFAANLGAAAVPLPPHREILLASEPDPLDSDGSLRARYGGVAVRLTTGQ